MLCARGAASGFATGLFGEAKKHEAIAVTAQAKRNTVHDHASKALNDNVITEEELRLIVSEAEKYAMKSEIRKSVASDNKEESLKYDEIEKCCLLQFRAIIKDVSKLRV